MSRVAAGFLHRRALTCFSRASTTTTSAASATTSRWNVSNKSRWFEGAALVVGAAGVGLGTETWYTERMVVRCDEHDDYDEEYDSGYTEAERFFHSLEYHRSLLSDYERRWLHAYGIHEIPTKKTGERWPSKVPKASEIQALELDLRFCERSVALHEDADRKKCQDLRFKIASFYIRQKDEADQKKGFKILKDLAEHGHPDGMCLYGIVLNEGRTVGVECNPEQAVVWWRRCMDEHRHITATYELALANYIGEGLTENTEFAVKLFRRAAHLGHAGAAYMLGECLLEGVGTDRDRGGALEWLVTAAELGHLLARSRVFTILQQEYEMLDAGNTFSQRKLEEAEKWMDSDEEFTRTVNIERRFSIGQGSRNPAVLKKRKSIIAESRDAVPAAEDEEENE